MNKLTADEWIEANLKADSWNHLDIVEAAEIMNRQQAALATLERACQVPIMGIVILASAYGMVMLLIGMAIGVYLL